MQIFYKDQKFHIRVIITIVSGNKFLLSLVKKASCEPRFTFYTRSDQADRSGVGTTVWDCSLFVKMFISESHECDQLLLLLEYT